MPVEEIQMQEETMKRLYTRRKLMIAGPAAALAVVIASSSASAQTVTSSTSVATITAKKKPTSATPQMIQEAIQRSQARSAKARALGTPEQWGSEEPFTFNPNAQ